jgi:ABC-type multidrug transport system fused ATPase/permease subunit
MVALFRIVELSQGVILIDDVDISQVPLQLLRSKLAIIPQDPVLLTGSIRFQLDPFETYSDLEVWSALEKVNMKDAVKAFPNGLAETIRENGENLSQGQRQLICIARALLRQAQVLVVDEGTSAVDPTTDELIQNVLRSEAMSRGTTVLAIAHRLQTIIDFDRILVLGAGTILEYDTPAKLMSDPESKFSQMLIESSL